MYKFLKKILCYFRVVEIYEKNSNLTFKCPKNYKFKIYKNFSNIKKKKFQNYFQIYIKIKKNVYNNCIFLTLSLIII